MDKKLQKAKEEYKAEVTFTENDRNKVMDKISEAKQSKPKKGIFHPFPVAAALIATLLIGFLFLSNFDQLFKQNTASPDDEPNVTEEQPNDEEPEDEKPKHVEPDIENVLIKYENTITSLQTEGTQQIDFDTIEEVHTYLTQAMSDSLAESHIDTYIEEREEGLYLVATEFPAFINTDEDYQSNQIDSETYHVTQEQDSELTNHIEITFIITQREDSWIVNDVNVKQLDQTSTNIESDLQAEEEVQKALQLDDQYQFSYEGQETPSEEYADQNLALIHVYEENENATATYDWYYINMDKRSIYDYELATNELTLLYEYQNGEYVSVE